jgi:hypothetical protein
MVCRCSALSRSFLATRAITDLRADQAGRCLRSTGATGDIQRSLGEAADLLGLDPASVSLLEDDPGGGGIH